MRRIIFVLTAAGMAVAFAHAVSAQNTQIGVGKGHDMPAFSGIGLDGDREMVTIHAEHTSEEHDSPVAA